MLKLMYITNNPKVARIAVDAGVDRVFIDMEVLGKAQRQAHIDSVKSFHTFDDIRVVRQAIGHGAQLLVRINPFYEGTKAEVDKAIECGADILMLPMWKTAAEVEAFVKFAAGRVRTIALLETKEADGALEEVLTIPGLDEIHIGLNDLHLSYGKQFLFEPLADGTVDRLCKILKKSGKPYGFGGVGRPGRGRVPSEYILAEHYRLGSGSVILSRSFCNIAQLTDYGEIESVFHQGVAEIRRWEKELSGWSEEAFLENHRRVGQCVAKIIEKEDCLV